MTRDLMAGSLANFVRQFLVSVSIYFDILVDYHLHNNNTVRDVPNVSFKRLNDNYRLNIYKIKR